MISQIKILFTYCDNNPVVRFDYDGELWQAAFAGGGTVVPWGYIGFTILTGFGAITPIGWVIIGTIVVISSGVTIYYYKEHTKGARPSTKSKHEEGNTRKTKIKGER